MITAFRAFLRSPRQRTQAEVVLSAALIVAGLLARYALGLTGLYTALMTAAALVAGADIAVRAFASLRNRHISIELLVTVATAGALVIGEVWEAAAVTFLFILGANLEARTLARTRQVLADLFDLAPVTALVLRGGQPIEVAPEDVQVGEVVLLKPGMKVPVDGEVLSGASAVDESMITGEPIPEEKTPGAPVFAGTVNLEGVLQVRATGSGADTTLARIIARVEEAQDEKAPTQRFIEGFARWYTPAIMLLSLGAYLFSGSIDLALTLLVIGCPGALVISTPVSVIAGIGQAARRGILIKGGEYLENSGRISALALDKTGTLTYGKPLLTGVLAFRPQPAAAGFAPQNTTSRWNSAQQRLIFLAGVAESVSEHPLARAITREAARGGSLPMPEHFETLTGKGIRAWYQGQQISVGKLAWLQAEMGLSIPADQRSAVEDLRSGGKTLVGVAVDGALHGVLAV
ncbi:MAG TPA: cation-translocating P-type ATPase, partial [Anaerolineaceae bacterium]